VLVRLGDGDVTELIASVLSNLVDGVLQMKVMPIGRCARAAGADKS